MRWRLSFKRNKRWMYLKSYKSEKGALEAVNAICSNQTITSALYEPIVWKECLWKIDHPGGGLSIFEVGR